MTKYTLKNLKEAEPKKAKYLLNLRGGLFLVVYPSGKKSYLMDFTHNKKHFRELLGSFELLSLTEARNLSLSKMADIKTNKAIKNAKMDFKSLYFEWLEVFEKKVSAKHYQRALSYYNSYFCAFGSLALLDSGDIIKALKPFIDNQKKLSFEKALGFLRSCLDYGVNMGYLSQNVAKNIKTSIFFSKFIKEKHAPHFDDLAQMLELKGAIENNKNSLISLRLLALFQLYTACRPCEARSVRWEHLDLKKGVWFARITKTNEIHEIYLSSQIIKALKPFECASGYVFKNLKNSPFSDMAVNKMLVSLGFEKSAIRPHGFRGSFATIANNLDFKNDIVQACLGHKIQNKVASAYNHATYKTQKKELWQWWGDKLGAINLAEFSPFGVN